MGQDPFAPYAVQGDPFAAFASEPATPKTPAEQPSALGFLGNVAQSGVDFAKNVTSPIRHPVATIQGILQMAREPTQTGRLIADALVKRYGSIDAALQTAYNDPVGMASDVSIVLGGATAAAKAAGALKSAKYLSAATDALNPLAIPAKVADVGGQALYTAAVNPSRRINRSFPGAMEAGMQRAVLPTEGGLARSESALEQSAATNRSLLKQADAVGAQRVDMRTDAIPALKEPAQKAALRYRLGGPDERLDVSQKAKELAARNPTGMSLETANKVKQQAQMMADSAYRAQERGAIIKDIDALSNVKVAEALRKAIEVKAERVGVSNIAASNKQTQALIGLTQALEEATHQPTRLTNLIGAATAGGGAMAGGGLGAGAAYGTYRALTAKPVMAAAGIASKRGLAPVAMRAQILRALQFMQSAVPNQGQTE